MTLRRMKTYTGGQGYVYQYYFVGKRAALASDPAHPRRNYFRRDLRPQDYIFSQRLVTGRKPKAMGITHGRALNEAEQYGAVKMRLVPGLRRN